MVPRSLLFPRFSIPIPRSDGKSGTPETSYSALGLQSNSYEVCPFPHASTALWTEKAARDCQPSGLRQQRVAHLGLQMSCSTQAGRATGPSGDILAYSGSSPVLEAGCWQLDGVPRSPPFLRVFAKWDLLNELLVC